MLYAQLASHFYLYEFVCYILLSYQTKLAKHWSEKSNVNIEKFCILCDAADVSPTFPPTE